MGNTFGIVSLVFGVIASLLLWMAVGYEYYSGVWLWFKIGLPIGTIIFGGIGIRMDDNSNMAKLGIVLGIILLIILIPITIYFRTYS